MDYVAEIGSRAWQYHVSVLLSYRSSRSDNWYDHSSSRRLTVWLGILPTHISFSTLLYRGMGWRSLSTLLYVRSRAEGSENPSLGGATSLLLATEKALFLRKAKIITRWNAYSFCYDSLINANMADFPILKNYLMTHGAPPVRLSHIISSLLVVSRMNRSLTLAYNQRFSGLSKLCFPAIFSLDHFHAELSSFILCELVLGWSMLLHSLHAHYATRLWAMHSALYIIFSPL